MITYIYNAQIYEMILADTIIILKRPGVEIWIKR